MHFKWLKCIKFLIELLIRIFYLANHHQLRIQHDPQNNYWPLPVLWRWWRLTSKRFAAPSEHFVKMQISDFRKHHQIYVYSRVCVFARGLYFVFFEATNAEDVFWVVSSLEFFVLNDMPWIALSYAHILNKLNKHVLRCPFLHVCVPTITHRVPHFYWQKIDSFFFYSDLLTIYDEKGDEKKHFINKIMPSKLKIAIKTQYFFCFQ